MAEIESGEQRGENDVKTPAKPRGAQTAHVLETDGQRLAYAATAEWLYLHTDDKPIAEVFHVFYELDIDTAPSRRPITFLFNGGPGAASAYLHVGAAGPKRVEFNADGTLRPPPVSLVDNADSWLPFTDMVFVDPVGTGFSRAVTDKDEKKDGGDPKKAKGEEFWKIERDLNSLSEFVSAFLSKHHRWDSPIFVAGESYGGFRAAKLARRLQEKYGVGLNGSVLISPALDFSVLSQSDYDVLPWLDVFPTLAAAAFYHGRSRSPDGATEETVRNAAEELAAGEIPRLLVAGDAMEQAARKRLIGKISRMIGLDPGIVERVGGRVSPQLFSRELLRDRGVICGLYDASVTCRDPFPARPNYEGPDPTLWATERVFASGINALLRRELEVETEREYLLLNLEVNRNWKDDSDQWSIFSQIQAVDDLRYAMSLNPHMLVRISHGVFDMVTPYRTSDRVVAHMGLDKATRGRLSCRHYPGGHMFYAWEGSRGSFSRDMQQFYQDATPVGR